MSFRLMFEVAVYHETEETFHARHAEDEGRYIQTLTDRAGGRRPIEECLIGIRQRYFDRYPMPWRYNQAVGFISIYALNDDQIRGELAWVDARRYGRHLRDKRFEDVGEIFQIHVSRRQANAEIMREIREHLLEAEDRPTTRKKRFCVDLEAFDNIAPHVDWRGMLVLDPPDGR